MSAQAEREHPYPLWLLSLFVCAGQEVAWRDAAEAPPLEGSRCLGPQHRSWPQTSVPLKWCHPEAAAGALLLPPGVQSGQLRRLQEARMIFPSYPELPLHQVSARDHLRDRVFNLQPRVHLHEVEVVLGVHDELHRTCRGARPRGNAVGLRLRGVTSGCVRASHQLRHSWQLWLLWPLLLQVSSELQHQFQAANRKWINQLQTQTTAIYLAP